MFLLLRSTRSERSLVRMLRQSRMLESRYYLSQLSLLERLYTGKSPELHYLRQGWKKGLDPHPYFSTNWYVSKYPDVAQSGMNPFVHFIRFGIYEERLPSENGVLSDFPELAETSVWYYGLAWTGFVDIGVRGLEQLKNSGDLDAAWYLAKWFFRYEDYETCLTHLLWLHDKGSGRYGVRVPSALAKCYLNLGMSKEASQYLVTREINKDSLNGALITLSYDSYTSSDRLESLNHLFDVLGLVQLKSRKSSKALSLSNLCAVENVPKSYGPLVSIVMTAFNSEMTISAAISSLLRQSWQSIEIIVVNDASSDGTENLISSLSCKDSRIRLINNQHNLGAYASRNIGMQLAKGEFITVHDSDDWSHPQKIEYQLNALQQNPDKWASQSYWVRVDPQMRAIGPGHMDLDWLEPNASSYMYRREVLETLGYWHEVNVSADTEYVDRMRVYYGRDSSIDVMPELPLSFSLVRKTSLTRNVMTHSRTFHYGLRNLYHQAAHWWHSKYANTNSASLYQGIGKALPFPVPIGNLSRALLKYDVLVVANGSNQSRNLSELLDTFQSLYQSGLSIAFYSLSIFDNFKSTLIADSVWEKCLQYNVAIAHEGLILECQEVRVLINEVVEFLPNNPPKLSSYTPIRALDGSEVSEELKHRLDSYLRSESESPNSFITKD